MPSIPFPVRDSRIWTSTMASRMAEPISRFSFSLWRVQQRLPRACWWSRCLAARPPSAPLFTYLHSSRANSRCARCFMIVNMANWSDKSGKILRNICHSTKMSTVNSIVVLLSHLRATSTHSAGSVQRIYLSPLFSPILELYLPSFKFRGLASLPWFWASTNESAVI